MNQVIRESRSVTHDLGVYDVDVSGNDIVVRCFRKIQYENGTMYESFVDMSTGLADGQGCVTRSAGFQG